MDGLAKSLPNGLQLKFAHILTKGAVIRQDSESTLLIVAGDGGYFSTDELKRRCADWFNETTILVGYSSAYGEAQTQYKQSLGTGGK
jgi:hypothetical protein